MAFKPVHPTFTVLAQNSVNKEIDDIVDAVLGQIGYDTTSLAFPSFGATILAECNSFESLLPAALEIRTSREAQGFRNWLNEMQHLLDGGNVARIARGLSEIRSVASDFRNKLGLNHENTGDVSLQIGLSPTFSFTSGTVKSVFNAFRSRPLHLSFLRRHFKSCLENIDVNRKIDKMIKTYKPPVPGHGK